ncbi:MAG: hypothetical protein HOI39_00425 [Flavobacteriales bacterium]|jgi:hypothetical protein|nr:hypothetical protein [Flavobacteriales bacterium]
MKKLLILLVTFISFNSYSQYVDDIHIKDLPAEYIMLIGDQEKMNYYQLEIIVDYGQISTVRGEKQAYIYDENGQRWKFNGMISALNLFADNGWEFVSQENYDRTLGDWNYLLRKKK